MATYIYYVNPGSTAGGTGQADAISGTDRAYASLSAAITAKAGSETYSDTAGTSGDMVIIRCSGVPGVATIDTTAVTVSGFTTGIQLIIEGYNGNYVGRNLKPEYDNVGCYALEVSASFTATYLMQWDKTITRYLQMDNKNSTDNNDCVSNGGAGRNEIYDSLRLRLTKSAGTKFGVCMDIDSSGGRQGIIKNCILEGNGNASAVGIDNRDIANLSIFNCTIQNFGIGIDLATSSEVIAQNNIFIDCINDWNGSVAGGRQSHNADSGDGDTPGTDNIVLNENVAEFIDADNGDYRVKTRGGTNKIWNAGTSGVAVVTEDILGNKRVHGSIGAFEYQEPDVYYLPAQTPLAKIAKGWPSSPNVKPNVPMVIDWSNPLTRGLVVAWDGKQNLVNGAIGQVTSGSPLAIDAKHGTIYQNSVTEDRVITVDVDVPEIVSETDDCTLFAVMKPAQNEALSGGTPHLVGIPDFALTTYYYANRISSLTNNHYFSPDTIVFVSSGNHFRWAFLDYDHTRALNAQIRLETEDGVGTNGYSNITSGSYFAANTATLGSVGNDSDAAVALYYHWTRVLTDTEKQTLKDNAYAFLIPADQSPVAMPIIKEALPYYIDSRTQLGKSFLGWPADPTQKPKNVIVDHSNALTKDLRFLCFVDDNIGQITNLATGAGHARTKGTSTTNRLSLVGDGNGQAAIRRTYQSGGTTADWFNWEDPGMALPRSVSALTFAVRFQMFDNRQCHLLSNNAASNGGHLTARGDTLYCISQLNSGSGTNYTNTGQITIALNTWYNLVVTWEQDGVTNGGVWKAWANGEELTLSPINSGFNLSPAWVNEALFLSDASYAGGADVSWGAYFERALSPDEAKRLSEGYIQDLVVPANHAPVHMEYNAVDLTEWYIP